MASEKNPVVKKIDPDLNDIIQEIRIKNDLNFRQASKEAAKILKEIQIKRRVIKF